MYIFNITAITIIFIIVYLIPYLIIQVIRANKVITIRLTWLTKNDPRYNSYSLDDMHRPTKRNLYGLKIPKDNDFK